MNHIITISREFGSGGRTVGKKVAEQLGIPCYDSELIQKIAEESGFAENYVKEAGEYTPGGFLSSALSNRAFGPTNEDILWEIHIGNLLYVLVAVVGGALALSGVVGNSITIGVIASFLQLTKSFTQPVTQISQQFNSIVMALAGAERIFELMDEEPEVDNGYVTLVNAKYDKNGELVETPEKTNIWAWKHPHEDGTTTYTQVRRVFTEKIP